MPEPRREPMAGIVPHGAQLRGDAERIGHAARGALVVGSERDADVTVVEDRVVRSVSLLDLVERLRNEERLEAIAGHKGQRRFKEIEPAKCRKLVEHQQKALISGLELFGQSAADLVED